MSDKLRISFSLLSLATIAAMVFIEGAFFPEERKVRLSDVLKSGPKKDMVYSFVALRDITSLFPRDIGTNGRILSDGQKSAKFIFPKPPIAASYVSVQGIFLDNYTFKVQNYQTHPERRWKWAISFFAMAVVFWLLAKDIHNGRISFRRI